MKIINLMRALSNQELQKVKILIKMEIDFTLIEPTETGLKKFIMDATASVRDFLERNKIHHFGVQRQGQESKVVVKAEMYDSGASFSSTTSLYRPITKKGDPRIWFSGLTKIANANDIIAFLFWNGKFHVFNLSRIDINILEEASTNNPLGELLAEFTLNAKSIAKELLFKLKQIALRGPIEAIGTGDTSIGRTLEAELGITINSSKLPDYKGIELKSFRSERLNRKNLFAQVPDWTLSKFKSSEEILNAFGYQRGIDFKLYCTISTTSPNSQGLFLDLDLENRQLIEFSSIKAIGGFVVWPLQTLHCRLLEKHKETFWVAADSKVINGREYFHYNRVTHTKRPSTSQFDFLVSQGIITVDHLIKRNSLGKVVEKGPLFKIKAKGIDLLFPPSEEYNLI